MTAPLLFILNLLGCFFMTGVIWIIQCVHYPSFRFVEPSQFCKFSSFHQNTITYVVAPAMIFELVVAVLLALELKTTYSFALLFLLGGVWLSTLLFSVPLHTKLTKFGYDRVVIDRLILTNWPRSLIWSLRTILLLLMAPPFFQ